MSSFLYPIVNAILFGTVLVEVICQIGFSFLNKQKLKSQFFVFLLFTCIWSLLRGILSIPSLMSNESVFHSILDLIYPSINCSFLILSRYYISVLYENHEERLKIWKAIWNWVVIGDYILFSIFSVIEWTSVANTPVVLVFKIIGMSAPLIIASFQLYITYHCRISVATSKSYSTFLCEIILNILILIHFSIDLLNVTQVIHMYFTPTNLSSILYVILLEIIPIQLILLLVYDFDIRTLVTTDEGKIPEDVISEYMQQEILISNPLLDYAYSRQDVENMVIATNCSHKDSEEYSMSDEAMVIHTSIDRMNSVDKNYSPTESIGSPLTF